MSTEVLFLVRSRERPAPKTPRPAFLLTTDRWDDFSHQVQFHLSYADAEGIETRIGTVKILKRTSKADEPISVASLSKLPSSFQKLGDDFISLGQDDGYYKKLYELFANDADSVLEALRDIAMRPALAADFEPTSAFRNAMMRENARI